MAVALPSLVPRERLVWAEASCWSEWMKSAAVPWLVQWWPRPWFSAPGQAAQRAPRQQDAARGRNGKAWRSRSASGPSVLPWAPHPAARSTGSISGWPAPWRCAAPCRRVHGLLALPASQPGRATSVHIIIDGLPAARDRLHPRSAGRRRRALRLHRRGEHRGQDGARST